MQVYIHALVLIRSCSYSNRSFTRTCTPDASRKQYALQMCVIALWRRRCLFNMYGRTLQDQCFGTISDHKIKLFELKTSLGQAKFWVIAGAIVDSNYCTTNSENISSQSASCSVQHMHSGNRETKKVAQTKKHKTIPANQ